MVDEIRGAYTMSGKGGSCPSLSDGSRQVGWWAGRLKGPGTDYVFAASVEASPDWLCVTYDDGVIAHFFTPDRREQMDLEGLWAAAPRVS